MIIPLNQSCNMMLGHDVAQHTGVVQPEGEEKLFFMPGTDGNMGRLAAYRTKTMEPIWSFQQRSSFLTGVLSTDGNVAFVGDYDRVFRAVETTSGKTLWTVRLPTVVQGNPVALATGLAAAAFSNPVPPRRTAYRPRPGSMSLLPDQAN